MGGTGGPGSDQTLSQQGLMGAGLLSGTPDEQAAKSSALGVEGAAQPSSSQLMGGGADAVIPATTAGGANTPVAAPGETPTAAAPPTVNFGDPGNTGVTSPAAPAFALAGQGNLGFPTGVTDASPLGSTSHVQFGTKLGDTATTGAAVTGAPIAAAAAASPAAPEYEFDMAAWMADAAAYNKANAAWGKPGLRPDAFPGPKEYKKLKGT